MRVRFAASAWGSLLAVAVLVGGISCKTHYPPDQPVKMAEEACCKFANEAMTKFAGCRITHRCASDEPIWLRGAVSCGTVEPKNCGGERCCKLSPLYGSSEGVLNWEDPDAKKKAPAKTTPAPETEPTAPMTMPPDETPVPETPATETPPPAE